MRTIWKFPLRFGEWNEIHVFGDETRVVLVDIDPASGSPSVWIEHEPDGRLMKRGFRIVGTGGAIPTDGDYTNEIIEPVEHVGSCICGTLVWHIYEKTYYND